MRKMTFEIKYGSETNKFKSTERYWSVLKNAKNDLWNKAWQLNKFKATERYWSVLKNTKNDLWNKAWQLTSSPISLQTIN